MIATVSLAVSLHQGRAIRDHIEDLSLVEGRHTKLPERLATQFRTASAAATTLASVALAAGRASLAGRAAVIPMVMMAAEGALALVGSCVDQGSRVASIVHALGRILPKLTALALVASTVSLAILQPLAGLGLAVHGLVALAERRQWISARVVTALLLATTVAGLALGLAFGSPLIQGLLVIEVLAFAARRMGAMKRALGLTPPAAPASTPQTSHVLAALGFPAGAQPIDWNEMLPGLPLLEDRVAGNFSGLERPEGTSLWEVAEGNPNREATRSLPRGEWGAQAGRICQQLTGWNERLRSKSQREQQTARLAHALHQMQGQIEVLKGWIQRRDIVNVAREAQELQNILDLFRREISNLPQDVQTRLGRALVEDLEVRPEGQTVEQIVAEQERRLCQQAQSLRRYVEGETNGWVSDELAAAAVDLPLHPHGRASTVLGAFEQLNQQFSEGNFGPGSISSPQRAQQGWGRCLQLMGELLAGEGDRAEASLERQVIVLRAIAQLVHKTHDGCSGVVLAAIEECFDSLRGVDRLQEGFRGFLRRVGTEEAAEWERNAVRWPRDLLQSLDGLGLPGVGSLRAHLGRPDGATAMTGAERMPWLNTSQTEALSMVRRSAVSDLEVGILATQVFSGWWSRAEVRSRLGSLQLLLDQAVHFLLTPEGRMAWHQALGQPEFRQRIHEQVPALQDQLDQLALPDALELENLMTQQGLFGVRRGEVMPRRLWFAALLLLDHCALLRQRPAQ